MGGCTLSDDVRTVNSPSLLPHCGAHINGRKNPAPTPMPSIDLNKNLMRHYISDRLESLEWPLFQNCLLIYIIVRRNSGEMDVLKSNVNKEVTVKI